MKYVNTYKDLSSKPYNYISVIHILSTGYLPINFRWPFQLNGIVTHVREVVLKTNQEYDLEIKRLHMYYDMKLITFATNDNSNLIFQLPVFVQTYSQTQLIVYQIRDAPTPYCTSKYLCWFTY